jgi:CubicO group peptidase (beta-lactamase class C family)
MLRKRLLEPLKMMDTRLDSVSAMATTDVATGHQLGSSGAEVMPRYVMQADAAGSVHTSGKDMARWLRFHLSGGLAEGKRVVSVEALGETHTPQMVMPIPAAQRPLFPDTVQMSYGMGWVIFDYGGNRLLAHGGAIDGFRTQITLVPDKKIGLAVLSNLHQTPMNFALTNVLLDQLLGLPKRDWHAIHQANLTRVMAGNIEKEQRRRQRRQHGTTPSRELAAYTGSYQHPAYGTAKIELKRGRLVWRWRDEEAMLTHFHYDTFTVQADLTGRADVTFSLGADGNVERLTITGNLGIEFRKVSAKTGTRRNQR